MKTHHLSCASMCPYGRRLISGDGGLLDTACLCCHCLLLETDEGLALVDTGLGVSDLSGGSRVPAPLRALMRPIMDPAHSALYQIRAMGFRTSDVRDIFLTHLDFDHAGGLPDFPNARVHVFAGEHAAAIQPPTLFERLRYANYPWRHQPQWQVHALSGERWEGFDGVRALSNTQTDILLVPTFGHTRGHCAVAVRAGEDWLLHCGDAYFFHEEMNMPPHCTPVLDLFQRAIAHDNQLRLKNQARLRQLKQQSQGRIKLFCAHDPVELKRYRTAA